MVNKIIEASELPEDEKVYLKKDFLGWNVVEPIRDLETKKIVWKNVFSKKGFFTLIILLIVLASCYLAFREQLNNYKTVLENPCYYCDKQTKLLMNRSIINWSNVVVVENDGLK